MKILVACEFSGRVREAFKAKGHEAVSCDVMRSETPGDHYEGDVRDILYKGWDMMIAFPPCTYLSFAGMRWNVNNLERQEKTTSAIEFFLALLNAPIERIAIENPVGVIPRHTGIKWTQKIQPWQFGHEESKAHCLWLKNLPILEPTRIMEKREQKRWLMPPSPDRWKQRSLTYPGIALAMAEQWG